MTAEDNKWLQYVSRIFVLLVVCVLVYFIAGEIFLPPDRPDSNDMCETYTGKWERIVSDGTREPVQMPGKCKAARNEVVTVETRLPEVISHDRYLCFRSAKQDMKFYIDGELRQQYSTEEHRLFGRTSAATYVFLQISEDDAGKPLLVETKTDSSYSGIFYPVYYGNPMGVWRYLFRQSGTELIVAFVTLVLSILAIIGSIVLRLFYRRKIALEYLGWGILAAAIWIITNSVFRQLIFPNISVINDITFYMIMLLPLPYLMYMNETQNGRYDKAYRLMEGILFADFVICSGLHMTNVRDFTDTISYIAVFCVLSILVMIVTLLIDFGKGHVKEYPFVAIGVLGVCIAAFIQIVIYFQRTSLFNGVILAIGLIFLLTFATISTVHEIVYMEREKQQAILSSELKGRFLANMSHEIRTPIHAVLGMDTMILRESTDSRIREYALDIQNAGQSLLSLINDILDLSKIESGKLEILPGEYDLSSVIHDVMNMITMKAQDKDLAVNLSIDENLPSQLWGDDVRIRQILVNLMNNAVKYTEKGRIDLTVNGEVKEDVLLLSVQVQDTGIGIRKEDIPKLFTEFQRIEERRNRSIEGTGLGMSITTQLLGLMGSQLQVESVYGEGSKFYFTLEQKIVDAEPIGDLEERIREQATNYTYEVTFTAPDANVLVVDDNAVNRRVFMNLLKATKVNVDEAGSGLECLERVREKHYDIVFLDHMMPGIDGIETLHRMKSWEDYPCASTPVVALTANAMTGAREMYLAEGFNNFLSKPVNPEKLEKLIIENLSEDKIVYEKNQGVSTETGRDMEKEPAGLPEVDGIDWEYALLHTKDLYILKDTVNHFYGMIETEAAQLEKYLKQFVELEGADSAEALEQFRIKVHAMKSSAAMIGAVSLSGIAKMLEYAARDAKEDVLGKVTPAFLEEWRNMKELLKPCVAEEEEQRGDKAKADYAMTREYLRLLGKAMEDMDVDTADDIMEQMKKFEYPESVMSIVEKIDLAVTNLDGEQVEALIQEFNEGGMDF